MVDLRLRMIAPGTLVALAITALTGCGRAESPRPASSAQGAGRSEARDVVLVTVDTLRYDATGFSGAGRVETPVMDAVAAAGAVFRFAHSHAVLTLPSHASILTGLYPYQHGLHDNAGFVLGDDVTTLPGLLARAGYRTGAFVSAFPLDRRLGLDKIESNLRKCINPKHPNFFLNRKVKNEQNRYALCGGWDFRTNIPVRNIGG